LGERKNCAGELVFFLFFLSAKTTIPQICPRSRWHDKKNVSLTATRLKNYSWRDLILLCRYLVVQESFMVSRYSGAVLHFEHKGELRLMGIQHKESSLAALRASQPTQLEAKIAGIAVRMESLAGQMQELQARAGALDAVMEAALAIMDEGQMAELRRQVPQMEAAVARGVAKAADAADAAKEG
jgi:hypothetical protein